MMAGYAGGFNLPRHGGAGFREVMAGRDGSRRQTPEWGSGPVGGFGVHGAVLR